MPKVTRWTVAESYEYGLPACTIAGRRQYAGDPPSRHYSEIAPGAEVEWECEEPYGIWSVERLVLSASAKDLIISRAMVGCIAFVQALPAREFIGVKAPADEEEDELIQKLQRCFRYQDHTKEEFQRAIAFLRPAHHVLDWPQIPPRQNWTLVLYNPTDKPVIVSGMISGQVRFENACRDRETAGRGD